jgi:cation diffusion facilitator CzcD-associated flavoprotein CzcO
MHRVVRASWSSPDAHWVVEAEVGERRERREVRCKFLYLCCGYYSYEIAHAPTFAGADQFLGRIVHPQWWPADLEYAGKRIVVIGSGATAVTLVPALAERAAHVVMLQRSPGYIVSAPDRDRVADALRAVLPPRAAHGVARAKNILLGIAFYRFCRQFPKAARRFLRRHMMDQLPTGFAANSHFNPRYNPWEQRLCLAPNSDLFKALAAGRASVVTDTIDRLTGQGIRLRSGAEIEADIIVTATGLKAIAFGGIRLDVDGRTVIPNEVLTYKGLMLSGVPNLAWCIGYTNASWTLRADLSSKYVCRLLKLMDRRGYVKAVPEVDLAHVERRPLVDLSSGYIARAAGEMPKQGSASPWVLKQNYWHDFVTMAWRRVDDSSMVFSRRET